MSLSYKPEGPSCLHQQRYILQASFPNIFSTFQSSLFMQIWISPKQCIRYPDCIITPHHPILTSRLPLLSSDSARQAGQSICCYKKMVRMRVHFLDLPFDILAVLFTQLEAVDFIKLCSSCSDLYEHIDDLDFWRRATHSKFRLPNRPSAKYNGRKWKSLYECLSKQTTIYLWGQHGRTRGILPVGKQHLNMFNYPLWDGVGIIADMQIGGWSTTILDNNGKLYITGPLNGERYTETGSERFVTLRYPGDPPMGDDHSVTAPSTSVSANTIPNAIPRAPVKSFSAGRAHVIALADDGTSWLWYRASSPAVELRFPDIADAKIEWVCAGWGKASVYIRHWGIVVWEYSRRWHELHASNNGFWAIPTSGEWSRLVPKSTGDHNVGKTIKHILFESFVLFITDKGKLFCSSLQDSEDTFEIPEITNVIDIQGSFRSCGIFNKDGSILVLRQEFLFQCLERSLLPPSKREYTISLPRLIPALQDSGVVQMAFGDYHFHALHSSGSITSYGREPSSSGALGLCGIKSRTGSRIRGVSTGLSSNVLLPHGYFTGRRVWFNEAKNRWQDKLQAALSQANITNEGYIGELGEWVEQRGSGWDDIPEAAELQRYAS
jgi:SCF-associated factor 1